MQLISMLSAEAELCIDAGDMAGDAIVLQSELLGTGWCEELPVTRMDMRADKFPKSRSESVELLSK